MAINCHKLPNIHGCTKKIKPFWLELPYLWLRLAPLANGSRDLEGFVVEGGSLASISVKSHSVARGWRGEEGILQFADPLSFLRWSETFPSSAEICLYMYPWEHHLLGHASGSKGQRADTVMFPPRGKEFTSPWSVPWRRHWTWVTVKILFKLDQTLLNSSRNLLVVYSTQKK